RRESHREDRADREVRGDEHADRAPRSVDLLELGTHPPERLLGPPCRADDGVHTQVDEGAYVRLGHVRDREVDGDLGARVTVRAPGAAQRAVGRAAGGAGVVAASVRARGPRPGATAPSPRARARATRARAPRSPPVAERAGGIAEARR